MANPTVKTILANTWVKVATNVNVGNIKKMSRKPKKYLSTYRVTGGSAPTELSNGDPIFVGFGNNQEVIEGSAIDVYVYAIGRNGKVRVSI